MRKKLAMVLGLVMILLFLGLAVMGYVKNLQKDSMKEVVIDRIRYISHGIIKINNDTEFTQMAQQEGWQGNGTMDNPYIISNYDIDIGDNPAGIEIRNTDVYFIIENCYLHHSTYTDGGYGIRLENVSNGKVSYTTADSNENGGIYIENSRDIFIDNSTFENTPDEYGLVEIHASMNVTVDNCTIDNDNLDGLYVEDSHEILAKYNRISSTDFMSIYLFNVTNSEFIKNDVNYKLTMGGWGIYMNESNYNYFKNNTIYCGSDTGGTGITLSNSGYNEFIGNEIHNGKYGILIKSSISNTFRENYIHNNSNYGIYISSGSGNEIYLNRFYYNNGAGDNFNGKYQACDNGTSNRWNSTSLGNYWHDWANNNDTNDNNDDGIVDWPYAIDGSAGARDNYPLKNPQPIPEFPNFEILIPLLMILIVVRAWRRIEKK